MDKKLIATVLLLLLTVHLEVSHAGGTVNGYTTLGQWTDESTRGALRTVTYQLSDFFRTQNDAAFSCINEWGGSLVTIQNRIQYDSIRQMMIRKGITQFVWTAGQQSDTAWFWLTTGVQIQPSQLIWNENWYEPMSQDSGLSLYGNIASFGMSNYYGPGTALRYICEV